MDPLKHESTHSWSTIEKNSINTEHSEVIVAYKCGPLAWI